MLRFLLILALSIYVLTKIGNFLFRSRVSSTSSRPQQRRPPDGSINVDSDPRKGQKPGNFKGGDYVDYEEIK